MGLLPFFRVYCWSLSLAPRKLTLFWIKTLLIDFDVCLDITVNWFWLTVHVFLDFDSSHCCVALATIRIPWSTFGPWSFAMPALNLTCLFYFVSERIWENEFRAPNQQFKQGNSTSLCAYSQVPYIDDQCSFSIFCWGETRLYEQNKRTSLRF